MAERFVSWPSLRRGTEVPLVRDGVPSFFGVPAHPVEDPDVRAPAGARPDHDVRLPVSRHVAQRHVHPTPERRVEGEEVVHREPRGTPQPIEGDRAPGLRSHRTPGSRARVMAPRPRWPEAPRELRDDVVELGQPPAEAGSLGVQPVERGGGRRRTSVTSGRCETGGDRRTATRVPLGGGRRPRTRWR